MFHNNITKMKMGHFNRDYGSRESRCDMKYFCA